MIDDDVADVNVNGVDVNKIYIYWMRESERWREYCDGEKKSARKIRCL